MASKNGNQGEPALSSVVISNATKIFDSEQKMAFSMQKLPQLIYKPRMIQYYLISKK
jgi:hypothetical protein